MGKVVFTKKSHINITSIKKKIQHTIMQVNRKWYQLINPWLNITDENFTEKIIFECTLRANRS